MCPFNLRQDDLGYSGEYAILTIYDTIRNKYGQIYRMFLLQQEI